jgi:beta-galactosidase
MKNELHVLAAYYPELWPAENIDGDILQMRDAGINTVRMGEFAWVDMEPRPGVFTLDFFSEVILKLQKNGIDTVFCTPSATPPIWLSHNHPERLFMGMDGIRMMHGARQHFCNNNPFFRKRSRIIVEAIAKRISKLPGLVAWQTDNEMKSHVSECCCDECGTQWRQWLKKRYGSIDELNSLWGTSLWSQKYSSFSQVPVPLKTPFTHNPSLLTNYRIFSREKIVEFQDEQVEIIRKYSKAPITHNSNVRHYLNHAEHYKNLDFASFDAYYDSENYRKMLMDYDIWRNLKDGRKFWVMETGPSHSGCIFGYPKLHKKSYLNAELTAAFALGAGGFGYWLWRQQRAGAEMPHGAIVSSWGEPTIGFEDVKQASNSLKDITAVLMSSENVKADLRMTYSDIARAFFLTEPLEGINYVDNMQELYRSVLETGFHRDLVPENADLTGCKLLLTPYLPHIADDFLKRALSFVKNGGTWIVGPLSGCRTADHTLYTESALHPELEKAAGVKTVYTFSPTNNDISGTAFGLTAPLSTWSSFFSTTTAKILGKADDSRLAGLAFLTENKYGKGKIVMLGSMPSGDNGKLMLKKTIEHYAAELRISQRLDIPEGNLAVPRKNKEGVFWFVINMDGKGCSFKDKKAGHVKIEPYGFSIIGNH